MNCKNAIRALSGIAVAGIVMAASPAQAKTAAAAQKTGVIDTGAVAAGSGEREFQQLYASWKALDDSYAGIANDQASKVAVPTVPPLETYRVSSNFGLRNHPVLGGRRAHKGLDMAAPTGTPVYAPADGYVARAGVAGGYGNLIELDHGGDLDTRYGHLSGFAVAKGDYVRKGELIGYVGSTGRSTGPHLHYEVRVAGEAMDPRQYMFGPQLASADSSVAGGSK